MFCSVTSDLQAHGFIKVLTEKFRTSLAQLLCHILKRLPVVVLKGVCSQAFEQLFLTLFDHVAGQLEDLQVFDKIVVQPRYCLKRFDIATFSSACSDFMKPVAV